MEQQAVGLWRRLAIEGPVIVISILLAFAIDAWWDERQQQLADLEQLRRVADALQSNGQLVEDKTEVLNRSFEATRKFMSWMGPEPDEITKEEFLSTWTRVLSIGFLALQHTAANDILATGRMRYPNMAELRQALLEWFEEGNALERQYALLRDEHAKLVEYTQAAYPGSHLVAANPALKGVIDSRFPFDQRAFLSDPHIESLLGVFLIRLKFVTEEAEYLAQSQAEVQRHIEAVMAE